MSDYATLDELRSFLGITSAGDTGDDARLGLAITAASAMIDTRCNRTFGVLTEGASFGLVDVPAVVRQACLIQASRLFARKNSPYGIAGSPEAGSEMRLLDRIDPDVSALLSGVRVAIINK